MQNHEIHERHEKVFVCFMCAFVYLVYFVVHKEVVPEVLQAPHTILTCITNIDVSYNI